MTQSQPVVRLMKGQLKETGTAQFEIDDNISDGIPEMMIKAIKKEDDFKEEDDQKSIDFLKDKRSEMTWGRRIALSLSDKSWYYPRAAENDGGQSPKTIETVASDDIGGDIEKTLSIKPSLAKAWAYFEHVALYRYILEEKKNAKKKNICVRIFRKLFMKGSKKMQRAEPGEKDLKTKLYPPIFTPHAQLGDFGLGIGLYFATLRATTIITFLAGLISTYNMNYFASDAYMAAAYRRDLPDLLKGSAICTQTSWVACPDCMCGRDVGDNQTLLDRSRCGYVEGSVNMTFALRNDCNGTPWQLGIVSLVTVIVILIAVGCLGGYLRRQEIQFDEDEQTAQDYSIRISNPPRDANDPEEWRRFFKENCDGAQVTVCTCAVHNDLLIRTLVERREIIRTIHNSLEPGASLSNLKIAYIAAKQERERSWLGGWLAVLMPGIPEFYARLVALNAKVQGLAQLDFPVTNVFVTFETESDQRRVLEKLSVGTIMTARNKKDSLSDPKYLFRGEYVLHVSEPDEPNTIRWQDLNAGFLQKVKVQALTVFATICAIILVGFIVGFANKASTVGAAYTIAAFNSVFPIFAKMLTDFEQHASEGEKQTSLYFKIALFRWMNTAVVISYVTPFTDTLTLKNGLISQVYALFFAEIVTTSAIQLADPMGHINRHIFAPRATTQDAMNLMFQGTEYELAERYTDMTKLLFLCVWYCSIYPGAFFMCSFALLVKYFLDRFSLMRTWKRAPQLGTRLSKFSRRYFFSIACVAMAIMSSYYWAGFPFDNLCPDDSSIDPAYVGTFTVTPFIKGTDETNNEVTFTADSTNYRFCNQNFVSVGGAFPFVAALQPPGDEWMTVDQVYVTTIFGWFSVGIAGIVVIKFLWGWLRMAQTLFHSSYKAVGDDQNIPFSSVASRSAYIPQVHSRLFSYPLIACDSDDLDEELYDWTDPDLPYSFYDLSKDADKLLAGLQVQDNVGFTRIKHWPPPAKVDSTDEAGEVFG